MREYDGVLEDIRRQSKVQGENGEEETKEEKITVIRGTWVWGDRSGKFACCKESDSSSSIFFLSRSHLLSLTLAFLSLSFRPSLFLC